MILQVLEHSKKPFSERPTEWSGGKALGNDFSPARTHVHTGVFQCALRLKIPRIQIEELRSKLFLRIPLLEFLSPEAEK